MADQYDPMKDPLKHKTPDKTLVDKIIELALGAGGGAVTLLSGLLAAVLIMYSGYVLYDSFATERAASSNAWDLLQFKPEIFDDYETPLNAASLSELNRDYRAWLTVYGTQIDYPVVQGSNDTYYAAVDIYGRPSLTGAIYLAAANSGDFSDSYNVIYGHHMDSGAMFGALEHMNGQETGVIVTENEIYDVQFFAVAHTDAYEGKIYTVGNRMNSVLDFLRSGGEGGVGTGTTVTYFNEEAVTGATKVVALSTCANASTNGRLVLFGTMTKRKVMTDVTIAKIWDDNENQDGIRPESLTVTLSNGDTAELTAENGWTATLNVPKFDNLGEIPYTWTEEEFPGYTLTATAYNEETKTTTFTNSHTPAVTSVSVQKTWADDEDRDRIRPESVTAVLSNGMTVTLSEANHWTATIDNLPVYDHGAAIEYTWTEEPVEGYELRVDGNTLINTHNPATTSLSVSKVWNDNNNQDGIRPETLTVSLYGNEELKGTVTLSESNSWTGTLDNLFVNEAGQPIVYRWAEETIDGYTPENAAVNGNATTLINTHVPATIDLTVSKVWDDNENQDGIRPRNLQVQLSDGRRVTLSESNSWTETITGLPKYAAGEEIEYTWSEGEIRGYSQISNVTNEYSTVITNRHETDTTVATVIKVWNDDNNRDGVRPESLTVTLSDGQQRMLSAENNWTATITGLPMNAGGQPIAYTWTEEQLEGYTSGRTVSGTTTTLTNTHEIETVDLTVTKVWTDAENQDGIRPASIHVTLNANNEPVTTFTLDEAHGWTATAEDQPVNDQGRPIAYTWTEEEISGYTLNTAVTGNSTVLTNTHIPATASLTVIKAWDDNNDQDGIRPESLTVTLSNGDQVTLTAEHDWTATIPDLPVYAAGRKIEYSWSEEQKEGYTLTGNTASGTTTTLTNTHTPAVQSLTVVKTWVDDEDRDRLRPSTLKVRLLANGSEVRSTTLNEVNHWTATFDNLPVFESGNRIAYSWAEDEISGYTLEPSVAGNTTTLTNTHTPATVTLQVAKVWDDDNNRDALRPDNLAVTLHGDDETERQLTLDEENGWTASIVVPVYERGRTIRYSWSEASVANYSEAKAIDGDTTTFTNTHVPAITTRTIAKVWDDADNQDGVRPESITVYLLANNERIRTITLSEENSWTYTTDPLFIYEEGKPVSYDWQEESVADYPNANTSTSGSTTTFTNIHVPETTELRVQKVWDDANNQDGIRPASLTVALLANGETVDRVELNAENNWTASIPELPVYAAGELIEYTWDEGEVEGYTASFVTAGNATIITNTHETARTVATIVKIWDDDDNRDGVRPESLTARLSTGATVELNAENNWTATVENLPKFAAGKEIAYTWTENETEGYVQASLVTEGTVTTITNHHDIATQPLTVEKIWQDDGNRDGIRPENLAVTLNGNQTVVLNEANGWRATVEGQPIYANGGREIIYRWAEEDIEGYQLQREVEGTITTLTNTHAPATVTRSITKVWEDNNNQDGQRPTTLAVTLNANGIPARNVNLTAGNNWTATLENLPVYAEGTEINYTWTERNVPGYTLTNTNTVTNANGVIATTITNTHEQETLDLTVRKVWIDENNANRPATLNMVLTGSNGEARVATLSATNNWTETISGLQRYNGGTEVRYIWTEPEIPGYVQTAVTTTGNTTVFTNTRRQTNVPPADYTLTIDYRYPDGRPAAPTYTDTYHEGDPYDIASPQIDGYRATLIRVTGVMPGRDVTYTVIYLPIDDTILIDDIDTPLGLGRVVVNVGDCLE